MVEFVELLLRWAHIISATALAGSIWFWYLAVHPSSQDGTAEWVPAIRRRWAPVVGASTGLLLATGLYNFIRNVTTYELPPWYHALGTIKIVLGVGIFYLAAKLTGSSQSAARFQQQSGKWLMVSSLLALILVGLGGVMRAAPRTLKTQTDGFELREDINDDGQEDQEAAGDRASKTAVAQAKTLRGQTAGR
jgi:hypothetical protein